MCQKETLKIDFSLAASRSLVKRNKMLCVELNKHFSVRIACLVNNFVITFVWKFFAARFFFCCCFFSTFHVLSPLVFAIRLEKHKGNENVNECVSSGTRSISFHEYVERLTSWSSSPTEKWSVQHVANSFSFSDQNAMEANEFQIDNKINFQPFVQAMRIESNGTRNVEGEGNGKIYR